jgi:ParB family chromosome partitioning protein
MSTETLIKIVHIPVKSISSSPFQPRLFLGDIEALSQNISEHGLQQPILARKISKGKYELISGARRLEAVRILGWIQIPAIIKNVSDVEAAALCVSENLQRANLNPIEEARAYKMLGDKFGLTHKEIATISGKSRPFITNALSLLKIDPFLHACLICGRLTISHLRIINTAPDYVAKYRLADIVMDWGLNVRELEDIVTKLRENIRILHWRRMINIEKIIIPAKLFTTSSLKSMDVIVDSGMVLLDGLETILNARRNGDQHIDAEVVYFTDWLRSSGSWVLKKSRGRQNSPITHSKFSQILAELVGDEEKMYKQYPVHSIKTDDDYLMFLPRAHAS